MWGGLYGEPVRCSNGDGTGGVDMERVKTTGVGMISDTVVSESETQRDARAYEGAFKFTRHLHPGPNDTFGSASTQRFPACQVGRCVIV